ncbi:MAG: hypothetical protein HUJ26_14805 [Planctomycetaceae bacterium]|nr:hypothetical protein [Planctomycetaceae bacterium]
MKDLAHTSFIGLSVLYFVVMILYSFRSEQTALGKAGLFDRGSFVPWSRVVEYRWFQDRSALLLIVDRWSSKSPMVIFPVQEELREQVELLLQEYAVDKRRQDVETALENLEQDRGSLGAASV